MRVTIHTNHAMRLLMYCAVEPGRPIAISEIARAHTISENHLTKIAQQLASNGFIRTMRGRKGGVILDRPPEEISIGAVVRATEENLDLAECFALETNTCRLVPECRFRGILSEALRAFFSVLDRYTIADLVERGDALRALMGLETTQEAKPQNAKAEPAKTEDKAAKTVAPAAGTTHHEQV